MKKNPELIYQVINHFKMKWKKYRFLVGCLLTLLLPFPCTMLQGCVWSRVEVPRKIHQSSSTTQHFHFYLKMPFFTSPTQQQSNYNPLGEYGGECCWCSKFMKDCKYFGECALQTFISFSILQLTDDGRKKDIFYIHNIIHGLNRIPLGTTNMTTHIQLSCQFSTL